jgi:hypothetical protein
MNCKCPKQSTNCFQCQAVSFFFRYQVLIVSIIVIILLVLCGQVQDAQTR